MSETKFSPGPWKAIRDPLHYGSLSTVYAGSTDEKAGIGAQMLVQIGGWSDPTEQEANANLIAAAPDMYEELECARDLFRFYQSHHEFKGGTEKAIRNKKIADRIDRLLAKARGEA